MNHSTRTLKDKSCFVYVGTYTGGDSEGIYICQLDMATGQLSQIDVARNVDNPSYLAIDAERYRLYSVNELSEFEGKPGGGVSAFAIHPTSGKLSLVSKKNSHGGAPCYLTIDRAGRHLFVANYLGGNIAVIPVDKDGCLKEATQIVNHSGSSIHPERQQSAHPHSIVLDSTNDYVFVPDLGLDKLMQYHFSRNNGRLSADQHSWTTTQLGSGPRHMIFHPDNERAYVINELSSTITAYLYDHTRGMLKRYQTISTVPAGYSGTNIAADLHLTADGRFLFGSNRGHDSIASYAVERETGWLTFLGCTPTQGKTPRGFAIDPSETYLLAANQDSQNIITFWIDKDRGMLIPTGHKIHIPSPVCLKLMSP